MDIKQNLVDENKYSIKCPYDMEAEFVVVHNTANDASAENEIQYMINNDKKISFHYAVDDICVIQGLPENRNAWHAGDGSNGEGNRKGIAVEICYSKSGGDKFIQAEKNAAEFIASKLKEKGWGIDKVKKHADFSNKNCPHRTLELGWDRFLDMINEHLDEKNIPSQENKDEGGKLEMARIYQNGSTPEPVYADTDLTKKIGELNPRETAEYLSIDNDRPLVRYKIDGTNTYKCGYVLWKGGCK